jgi:hypothetical protein
LYRFASGQTDYLLGAYRYESFYEEYFREKRSIYEQVLNLTRIEKQKIFDFLLWNAKPENRVYRYNFFFDNCATRVRDVLEEQVDGTVVFPPDRKPGKTYRELIKEYHAALLWLNFGIDLVVSAPSDKIAPGYDEMFLPDYLMEHFAKATISSESGEKPLVKSSAVLYQSPGLQIKSLKAISPFVVFGILFLLVLFISVKQFRNKKIKFLPDYLVFGITGFMGIVILWFVLYSEHPAMNPNYNLLWAVPLSLVFAILWKVKKWRLVTRFYFVGISVWMFFFLVLGIFLPQQFHPVIYFFVLIVLSRSLLHTYFIFKKPEP